MFYTGIQDGRYSIVLTSPELLVEDGHLQQAVKGYGRKLCLIAVDKVHCLSEW